MRILSFEKNKQGFLLVLEDYRQFQIDEHAYYEYSIYDYAEAMYISDDKIDVLENAHSSSLLRIMKRYAFVLLSRHTYSTAELKKKLVNKFNDDKAADTVIEQLVNERYLDDDLLTENYIEYHKKHKLQSEKMVKYKLRAKGIDDDTITGHLEQSEFSEYDNALKLYKKKYLKLIDDNNETDIKRRAYAYLVRKGYSSEVIRKVLGLSLDNIAE